MTMLFFVLMPLCLLVVLPLLTLWLGIRVALWAKQLAARYQEDSAAYPTAKMLEATFEAEPEGVWPPKPMAEQPWHVPGHEWPS